MIMFSMHVIYLLTQMIYVSSGNLELSAKYFQDLIVKDQNHPAALMNYAAILLCKHGSIVAGAGANASEGASGDQFAAINVARECLLAAVKSDPKAAHTWANLANAYYLIGDHRSSSKCLEKAAKLEPNCMSTRYAVAVHRIKDVERSQDPSEQLSWAGNEMASVLREGDSVPIEPTIAWAGLAMVHKAQHEIVAAFETDQNELVEVEERAIFSLKQATAEDPDDAVQWNQLGLDSLCSQHFKMAQKYLKAAVVRFRKCSSYAWSNLGISLQLSEETSQAECVYKRALSLATTEQAHAIFSNLGNLYRQQKQYDRAKAMFTKSLELQPGYAPAFNNLGLVFVAEGHWEEAKFCFDKALQSDPLLDAAKSNMIKTVALSRLCAGLSSFIIPD
ncbi:putative UDP-N-acetylglucosamine--peptide N-acetylglucosaminyltransferase SPINDLY [Gossypium australe]|uniref:Putative UDP-N-acetylglucosamine--peptide N-acetylglucosaminyltransferase SPINDLY n=1 Tax=Gossypium australe TaxID=47621 RepID=A0A5B6UUG0_9ROSI|nr:putative UDP-N-acetylglucosamine--peptide N-acetylglucosaminyltransferase SPINDLY [Gossypium australe]